jgi:hypothetical protein
MEPVVERKCSGGLSPARGREAPLNAAGRITVAPGCDQDPRFEFKRLCAKSALVHCDLCVLCVSVVRFC